MSRILAFLAVTQRPSYTMPQLQNDPVAKRPSCKTTQLQNDTSRKILQMGGSRNPRTSSAVAVKPGLFSLGMPDTLHVTACLPTTCQCYHT